MASVSKRNETQSGTEGKKSRTKRTEQKKSKFEKVLIEILSGVIVLLMLLSAVFGIADENGNPLVSWDEIYRWFGVESLETQVLSASDGAATRIHFIDIGQGDSVLLEQDGHFALIDAGLPSASESLLDYLKKAGVETLDFMLMTHPHADHIGSMQDVIENFNVKKMILPDFSKAPMATSSVFLNLLECIDRNKISAITAKTGDVYPLGSAQITVISDGIETDDLNNISVVTMFEAPGMRFLSGGDAEKEVEQSILESGAEIRADLFKAGHHGSSTSNTPPFMQAVHPRAVVICCGKDNSYGHPHAEAMEAFAGVGAQVYRTDRNGTVIAYVDEEGRMQIAAGAKEAS